MARRPNSQSQRPHSADTARQIVNGDAPKQRMQRIGRHGYTESDAIVPGERLWLSIDGEHTVWCERIDGVPMVVLGDSEGVAVAYVPAAVAVVFGMEADNLSGDANG